MCDDEIAEAIDRNFTSPNESDSNFEQANVVDGLFAIARSILELAEAVKPAAVVEDKARDALRRTFGESLPGPYRLDPEDGNAYRVDSEVDSNGRAMCWITDTHGGHNRWISKEEYMRWEEAA